MKNKDENSNQLFKLPKIYSKIKNDYKYKNFINI